MRKGAWLVPAAALAVAGCFNEPEPAYKTVPDENRIYLSDKKLTELPKLNQKADYLNLDRNALTNIDAVAAMTSLKWLRLNDNRLSALPDLKGLVSLRRIYLRNNRFTEVPGTLADLPLLTDIDISGNPVGEVPQWLARKTGLRNLSFSRTRISKLPDDLSAWKDLKSLQLGDLNIAAEEMKRIRGQLPAVAIVF